MVWMITISKEVLKDHSSLFSMHQSGVHHALNPDQYRGVFGSDGERYAKDVQEIIDFGTSGHVAAFISEGIQVRATTGLNILSFSSSLILQLHRE